METERKTFLDQLVTLWSRLNSSERLIIVASVLILIVAIGLWLTASRQPNLALLYGNLDPTDAGQVISDLEGRNISYDVKDGGKSILVPSDKVDELRISLAAGGFTPTGISGYEILDKSPMGMSDFLQRRNNTRAIEGELARTLMSLDEVSAARVHLTLQEPTPFISEQVEPIASVVLGLSPPGTSLSREKVGAVRTFVAGAMGSLVPDNVTIIDQNMNLLTGPSTSQPGGLLPTQEEARRSYEMQRAADIRSLLEKAYGIGKVAVSFSCEMDFDQVQTESLTYEPVSGTEHGVLMSEERTEDATESDSTTAPVGIPGTESNIPSYVGTLNQPYTADSSTETKNYEISTTHEMRTQAPGTIKHSSVGILIHSDAPEVEGAGEISTVEGLVASAAGLDLAGSDNITVAFRSFDTGLEEELAAGVAEIKSKETRDFVVKVVMSIIVLLIVMFVLIKLNKPIEGVMMRGAQEEDEDKEQVEVELPEVDPETMEKLRIREEIERMIKEDPGGASKVIKTWLKE